MSESGHAILAIFSSWCDVESEVCNAIGPLSLCYV